MLVSTKEPLTDIIEKLSKILDVTPANEKETLIFKESNVSHKKLCAAFEYWIDQCKMIFREPVLLYQNQSLRDAGVDLSMRFMISDLSIGFQIKSYGDVKEKTFHTKVNAQITQSHRHNLKKLILAVAGNLTDSSQSEKIRGLFSEIQQQNDDYVIIIPPEKVVTIYNTFVAKEHPLKSVLLDISDLMKFTTVLENNLSNEKRTVKITVDVKFPTPPSKEKAKHAKFTLRLKDSDVSLFDSLENLHLIKEPLTFSGDQITQFKVFDEEGKMASSEGKTVKLVIKPEQKTAVFTLRTLDEKDNELSKLENLSFKQTIKDQSAYFHLDDEKQKAISMEIVITKKIFTFQVKTDYANSDVVQLQNAINFVESCRTAKKLNVLIPADGVDDTLDAPDASNIPSFNNHFRKLNDALVTIQQFSGIPFTFPTQYYPKEYNEAIQLSENLKVKQIPVLGFSFTMQHDDALDFLIKYKNDELKDNTLLSSTLERGLFQKKIKLVSAIKLSDFALENNIDESISLLKKEKKDLKLDFKPKKHPAYATFEIDKSSKE